MNTPLITQPHAHLRQSDWGAVVGGVYTLPCVCKGVELDHSTGPGTIIVHLIDDPSNVWYITYINATERKGMIFDKINNIGTVDLAHISVFPAQNLK